MDEPELSHNGFLNGWVAAGSHNGDLGEGGERLRVTQKPHLGKGGRRGRGEVSESVILTEN